MFVTKEMYESIFLLSSLILTCFSQGKKVSIEDIKKVYSLFVDVKRSVEFLKEYEKEFMFNETSDNMMIG